MSGKKDDKPSATPSRYFGMRSLGGLSPPPADRMSSIRSLDEHHPAPR
jgi:hypothetical protein